MYADDIQESSYFFSSTSLEISIILSLNQCPSQKFRKGRGGV